MTLNGYFALNSVFAQIWLARAVRLSKNNCVKINKDAHILSAAQTFDGESTFWQYKVCADIRSGSQERTGGSRVNARLEHSSWVSKTTE